MSLSQETVVVERVTQYGFKAGGKNYGLSPKLKGANITPASFEVGSTYLVEIWTGPQGGKSVNSFSKVGAVPAAPPPAPVAPVLPPTTVAATPAPGGVPPVAPAKKSALQELADDKMSKADWQNKDRLIGIDAVIKSSLESPALGQLVVGKNQEEAFQTSRDFIRFNLETQRLAKEGTL